MAFAQWLAIFIVGLLPTLCSAMIKLSGKGQSFSSVIKDFKYKTLGAEVTLYEKTFDDPGYVTEQWFTSATDEPLHQNASGMDGHFHQDARIRIYIDSEKTASLDYMLTMGQAVHASAEDDNTTWSSRLFGRLANSGGYFNTFRIPFTSGIKITVTNDVNTGALWYIVRGLVGVPLSVGSFELPDRTRLRVYKQDKVIAPLEFVTLSNTTNKAGMLFLVTFDIKSDSATFMEGCVRANIDDSNDITFLSSGTEDFFLSAFYFNRGEYHGFHSGLTYKSKNGDQNTQIVAYKFFVDDPVLFRKSFRLIWRNFEELSGANGCPNQFPANEEEEGFPVHFSKHLRERFGSPTKARIQSYVWVYEWDMD